MSHRHRRCTACPKRVPPSRAVHATLTDHTRAYDVYLCADCYTRTCAMAPARGVTVRQNVPETAPPL